MTDSLSPQNSEDLIDTWEELCYTTIVVELRWHRSVHGNADDFQGSGCPLEAGIATKHPHSIDTQARDSHTRIQANAQDLRATTSGGDQFPGPLNHDCFCQRLGPTFARPCTRARCICGHAPDDGTHIDLEESIGITLNPVATRQMYAFVAQEAEREVETSEANTHPFIVKIWLEETAEEARQSTWRGQITHVPSGKRRAFSDLSDITAFIVPYLESMGVKPGFWQRVKQRLIRLRH